MTSTMYEAEHGVAAVSRSRGSTAGIGTEITAGNVLLIEVDTVHPGGGIGGSVDSDECAWLVRTLVERPDRRVVIATRHQSDELVNDHLVAGKPPRVLAAEFIGLLAVRQNVAGWISGRSARPRTVHHGGWRTGFWEASPSALGFAEPDWESMRAGALRAAS